MARRDLSLLNVFEVFVEGAMHHYIGFLDPVRAGAEGIISRAILGEYTPTEDGKFDASTFKLNPEFIAALTDYMNDAPSRSTEAVGQAQGQRTGWVYVLDSRTPDPDGRVPPGDIVGAYAVDETGQIVPNSFQYNSNHVWFDEDSGISGLLSDRQLYDWIHKG